MPPAPSPTTQTVEIDLIKAVVAKAYNVTVRDIDGPSRVTPLPEIRHVAMAISRKLLGASHPVLASSFRRGNHCTIIHAIKQTEDRVATSREFATKYATVERIARNAVNISRAKEGA